MQLERMFVMIRKLLNGDVDRVADIWLKTNLKAHYFISNRYWTSNYELVKEMVSQSEVYVFEADKMIQGFVGLNDEYIEGIFVAEEMQSCGIGKLLLDYIKDKKVSLRLNVYQKNARAISFYQREGFIIQCEGLDEATDEKEYTMLWKRKQESRFLEVMLAWKLHATFWRDKTPFKKSRENFYENNKEGKLKNLLDNFYYKEDIDSIANEIEKLLNCG